MASEGTRRVVVDDTHPKIQYFGPWTLNDGGPFDSVGNFGVTFNKTLHTATGNASLSFAFNGSSGRIIGTNRVSDTTANHDPAWSCTLDGIGIEAKDPFQFGENNWEFCAWKANPGPHVVTLNITSKGRNFYFDTIHYFPSPDQKVDSNETIAVSFKDPAIVTSPGWQNFADMGWATSTTGANLTFAFRGTGVRVVGTNPTEINRNGTTATYSIDNQTPVSFEVPAARGVTMYSHAYFETASLPYGDHTLSLVYGGNSSTMPIIPGTFIVYGGASAEDLILTSPTPSNSRPPIGAIVGGVVGGLVVLLLIAFFVRKYRHRLGFRRVPFDDEDGRAPDLFAEHPIQPFTAQMPSQPVTSTSDSFTALPKGSRTSSQQHFVTLSYQGEHVPSPLSSAGTSKSGLAYDSITSSGASSAVVVSELHHQDSGIRLGPATVPVVVEHPPSYTPS